MVEVELVSSSGQRFPLNQPVVRMGRGAENEISISDPALSRNHLVFKIQNGLITLEDAGSQNGFSINGAPAQGSTPLKVGDRIRAGSQEYILVLSGSQAPFLNGTRPTSSGSPFSKLGSFGTNGIPKPVSRPSPRDISFARLMGGFIVAIAVAAIFLRSVENNQSRNPASVDATITNPVSGFSQDGFRETQESTKSLTEIQSDARFRESLRDYYNKNYSRAVLGFKDALTLNPAHVEAADYLQLSENSLKSQLDETFNDATRSFSNLQYRRARSQALRVLIILSEQVPSYSRRIAQDIVTGKESSSVSQEEILEKLPCEKSRASDLCNKAKDLLRQARKMLKEEETLR